MATDGQTAPRHLRAEECRRTADRLDLEASRCAELAARIREQGRLDSQLRRAVAALEQIGDDVPAELRHRATCTANLLRLYQDELELRRRLEQIGGEIVETCIALLRGEAA